MNHFAYKNDELYCEDVSVAYIAEQIGTPFYLYSYSTIKRHFMVFEDAFADLDHLTCFSVKSNSNLAILRLLANSETVTECSSGIRLPWGSITSIAVS